MNTAHDNLGKLIGNTSSPTNLRVALRGSFSARRGATGSPTAVSSPPPTPASKTRSPARYLWVMLP